MSNNNTAGEVVIENEDFWIAIRETGVLKIIMLVVTIGTVILSPILLIGISNYERNRHNR
jgi:hypothetical protein